MLQKSAGRKHARLTTAGIAIWSAVVAGALPGAVARTVHADTFVNNGGTALSSASSWNNVTNPGSVGVPGSVDFVQWGGGTGTAGSTTYVLGGDTAWQGITVANAVGAVVIDQGGSNLTLGPAGVTVAGTGQALTMSPSTVALAAAQGWNVGTGATLAITGAVVDNGFALSIAGAGNSTISGVISGVGNVSKSGTGVLTLSGASNYQAATSIAGGSVVLDFSTPTAPTDLILPSGTALSLTGGGLSVVGSGSKSNVQVVASLTVATGVSSLEVTPGAGQTANFVVNTSVTRTQGNTSTNVGGTLRVGTGGTVTFITLPNRALVVDGGNNAFATFGLSDWAATNSAGRVVAASYVTSVPTSSTNLDVTADVTLSAYSAGSMRFNSGGTVTVTQNGIGTVGGILMTPNSGGATITGSSLRPNHVSTSGASLTIVQNSTAAALNIAATIVNATPAATSVVKSGAGTVVLSNSSNSYTGDTFLNEGTISISANGALGLPSAAAPLIFSGGTLLATANVALNATTGSGNRAMTLNSAGGTLMAVSGTVFMVPGVISGSGSLTIGGGTVVLSGANNYSGGTVVSGGMLVVANTGFSAAGSGGVVISGGGSIGGTGAISGVITAGSGANTISPGATGVGVVGTLSAGGLATNGNTTIMVDLSTPGGVSDLLMIHGDVTLGGGTLVVASQASAGSASLGYYPVISYSGTLSGVVGAITLPAVSGNFAYTLDATHDAKYIDVHRGFVGDANDDGTVDLNDLNTVLNHLGTVTAVWGDGNFDGAAAVDLNDLNAVLNHLGTGVASGGAAMAVAPGTVPEAATVGILLGVAPAIMTRRRRRQAEA